MIRVTRFNGGQFFLNPDLILSIEATPDTIIRMTTGEKFVVKETADQVVEQFMAYKRLVGSGQGQPVPEVSRPQAVDPDGG